MDRAEKLGLGAAIGGHAVLLGAMVLGLFLSAEPLTRPEAISVSLVGEIADVSTAPDAIQEESAPPASAEAEAVEPTPTPVMKLDRDQPKAVERPVKRDVPPPPAKTAAKKIVQQQPPAKTAKAAAPRSPGFSKSFEDAINSAGKAPGAGKAVGTPASRSASVIRSATSNTIAAEVRPLIPGCAPRTSDNSSLRVFVALNISPSANLVGADVYDVQGITPSNEAQVDQMKRCVLQSLKAASPYNLDPEEYEVWKGHKVQLKVNFK